METMTYKVATTKPIILSASAYSRMQQGYRLEKEPIRIYGEGLTKQEAIDLFDSISIKDAPTKAILDENNLSVNTCHINDNYTTNICTNHKGRA